MKKIYSIMFCGVFIIISLFTSSCNISGKKTKNNFIEYSDNGIDKTSQVGSIIDVETYKIILPINCTSTENLASLQLKQYIKEATNFDLEILNDKDNFSDKKIISIGDTVQSNSFSSEKSKLIEDGFLIKIDDDANIYILGSNNRSILYGVYDFLEQFVDIHFLTIDNTYVPNLNEIKLYKTYRIQNPAFPQRCYLNNDSYHNSSKQIEYASHMRFSSDFQRTPEIYGGNGGWCTSVDNVHNSLSIINVNEYCEIGTLKPKPEYKDMFYCDGRGDVIDISYTYGITDDGKIDEQKEISPIKIAIEQMKKLIITDKDASYFSFTQTDVNVADPADNKLAERIERSGITIRFINILASELQKWSNEELGGRKINIVMLAYQRNLNPPVKKENGEFKLLDETCKPLDNVYIRIAPLASERYYSLTEEFQSPMIRDLVSAWGFVSKNTMFWTYEANYSDYLWYFNTMQTWRENLTAFNKIGATYVMMQSTETDTVNYMQYMEAYVASKMLWNPIQNVNELRNEFIHYYFGELIENQIISYFDKFDLYYASIFLNNNKGYGSWNDSSLYKYSFLQSQVELLDNVIITLEKSTLPSNLVIKYINNVKRVQLTPRYMIMINYESYTSLIKNGMPYSIYASNLVKDVQSFGGIYMGEGEKYKMDNFKKTHGID